MAVSADNSKSLLSVTETAPENSLSLVLDELFLPTDYISIYLIAGNRTEDFVKKVEEVSDEFLGELKNLNKKGYNAYCVVNPVVPQGGRKKEHIAEIRNLFADFDKDGAASLAELGQYGPKPHFVIQSGGPNRLHCIWRVRQTTPEETAKCVASWSTDRAEQIMERIAAACGGDKGLVNKGFRLPGFLNWNHGEPREAKIQEDTFLAIPYGILDFKRFPPLAKPNTQSVPAQIIEGSRNNTLTSIAGSLQRLGLSDSAVREAVLVENQIKCEPPLGREEVLGILKSVKRYEKGTLEPVPAAPKNWRDLFRSVSQMETGEIKFYVEDTIPEGICFFGGLSGEGKTLLGMSLAKALCTGTSWLRRFRVPERIPVLYLIPEAQEKSFRLRCEKFQIPDDENWFLCRTMRDGILKLNDPLLLQAVQELRPAVFLDTAIRFAGGEENSATDNNKTLFPAISALINAGARVVVGIHHAPKAFAQTKEMTLENVLRGTGDFGAMCDVVYGVRKDRSKEVSSGVTEMDIVCVKGRDTGGPPPFRVACRYQDGSGVLRSYLDEIHDLAILDDESRDETLANQIAEFIEERDGASRSQIERSGILPRSQCRRILEKYQGDRWNEGPRQGKGSGGGTEFKLVSPEFSTQTCTNPKTLF